MQAQKFRHSPVMLGEVLTALAPRDGGIYVDATFGAGGYSHAILEASDCKVVAIDRDPDAVREGAALVAAFPNRLTLIEGRFGDMAELLSPFGISAVDGVALDVGVSSMQLDRPERGFSFAKDGPLDMRMSQAGPTAADIVNRLTPEDLSRIIAVLGEERRARAIAKAIARARAKVKLETTLQLVAAVEQATGRQRHDERIHPATRTFQALRVYVNGELDELAKALAAAERLLKPEGRLAVVTFHSLEDRIVKRFLAERSGPRPSPSRHQPSLPMASAPSFELLFKGHMAASDAEAGRNPRARSAKLRAARRTEAPAFKFDLAALGVPLPWRSWGVLMLRFFNTILVLVSLGAAFVLYSLEHATRSFEREIADINRQISDERETMKLLAAEWSNLTQPARLQKLAEEHLKLQPMNLLQLASPQELAARLPERPVVLPGETSKDPIADILKAME